MVASLTLNRPKYASVQPEMQCIADEAGQLAAHLEILSARDSEAYRAVIEARKSARRAESDEAGGAEAVRNTLVFAIHVPLEIAKLCVRVAKLAVDVAERGNTNAKSDAIGAAIFAIAACRVARLNVLANAQELEENDDIESLVREADELVKVAEGCGI